MTDPGLLKCYPLHLEHLVEDPVLAALEPFLRHTLGPPDDGGEAKVHDEDCDAADDDEQETEHAEIVEVRLPDFRVGAGVEVTIVWCFKVFV